MYVRIRRIGAVHETFVGVDDGGVVDAITDAARRQNVMCARELAAAGELYARRAPEMMSIARTGLSTVMRTSSLK